MLGPFPETLSFGVWSEAWASALIKNSPDNSNGQLASVATE